ncbi:MAG: hypothetical protein HZA91_17895 [Verrucomicrobia bacterium]|nr:hypothetical protein [Verrucomicrobiota bacterium]
MLAPPATTALQESIYIKLSIACGKACFKRGGNLSVIIEDKARGAGLARDHDNPTTWVWPRR